jgi:hypothetical protein
MEDTSHFSYLQSVVCHADFENASGWRDRYEDPTPELELEGFDGRKVV